MVKLLSPNEPAPVGVVRPDARSPFFLLADHGGNRVPASLANLELPLSELERHIGVDIGILDVGLCLSEALDATLVHQRYSRLVIDCNRLPRRADAIPEKSDGTVIPGNLELTAEARNARQSSIFDPYHRQISDMLEARQTMGRQTVLVALHSFTPQHGDFPSPRPWHIGVLWNRDPRLAHALICALQDEPDLIIGHNEPYGVSDDIDYAIPVHAEARGLIHVELEIRQDLIGDELGQKQWAKRLSDALPRALQQIETGGYHVGQPNDRIRR